MNLYNPLVRNHYKGKGFSAMEKSTDGVKKLGVLSLVAIVLSSSIGSGIYDLPSDMSVTASPGAALIAWIVSGIGMIALCLATARLYERHHQVRGIYGFATEGFGKLCGFLSGWGYYIAALVANIAFATMMMNCLGYFFPIFGDGSNVVSIIAASICTWILYFVVKNGIESATVLNAVIMICKLVPLFVFVVAGILTFRAGVFTADFWGTLSGNFELMGEGNILEQCQNSLVVILWVFIGVEAAAMMSDRAKSKAVASRATILGVVSLLLIYLLISMLPYGMMPREEIAALGSPVLAYLLESVVGTWGAVIIQIGMIISIAGAWLSWTIIPAEVSQCMAEDGLLPKKFSELNGKGAPGFALLFMTIFTQVFLLTLLVSQDAYLFCYTIASCGTLLTWSFVVYYLLKQGILSKGPKRASNLVIGIIGSLYFTWAMIFGGGQMMLLIFLVDVVGIAFYIVARRENGTPLNEVFKGAEWAVLAFVVVAAIASLAMLANGTIVI